MNETQQATTQAPQELHEPPLTARFQWDEAKGIGFYPVKAEDWPYDNDYFEKYVGYAATEQGRLLTRFRVDLVAKYVTKRARVQDVGIGCGSFIEAWLENGGRKAWGFDVNPVAINWLKERKLWRDPYVVHRPPDADCVTCWDSLEHLPKPEDLIAAVPYAFACSLPIFTSREHVLSSRHFRPTEHYWYFTEDGLIGWMERQEFRLLDQSRRESELGREDIGSYVFVRQRPRSG